MLLASDYDVKPLFPQASMGIRSDKAKVQLNVRVTAELKRRVGMTAAAREEPIDKFVSDVLNERTRPHKKDTDSIVRRERKATT